MTILNMMVRPVITEAQVRRIVQEEVVLHVLQEGMWDDVKSGAIKLKALVTQHFGQVALKWGQVIQNKLSKMANMPDDVVVAMQALKAGMKDSGESISLDDSLKAAKELGSFTKEKALAVAQSDMEGPIHDYAKQIGQQSVKAEASYHSSVYEVLLEGPGSDLEQLNEFGVTGALGVGLAIMGGLPMLFKGLRKLARALHAPKLVHLFGKAEHVTHSFEVKTINAVIPNKLSYGAYKLLHSRGLKFSKETKDMLSYEEFSSDADGSRAMKQVNSLLYKSLLIYFAFSGLSSVLHAGASMVGFVEGTATTVKGVELASGAMEIAALAGKSV